MPTLVGTQRLVQDKEEHKPSLVFPRLCFGKTFIPKLHAFVFGVVSLSPSPMPQAENGAFQCFFFPLCIKMATLNGLSPIYLYFLMKFLFLIQRGCSHVQL